MCRRERKKRKQTNKTKALSICKMVTYELGIENGIEAMKKRGKCQGEGEEKERKEVKKVPGNEIGKAPRCPERRPKKGKWEKGHGGTNRRRAASQGKRMGEEGAPAIRGSADYSEGWPLQKKGSKRTALEKIRYLISGGSRYE